MIGSERYTVNDAGTITIELIGACIAFGKAAFTFTFAGEENEPRIVDKLAYGVGQVLDLLHHISMRCDGVAFGRGR